jgi:hypothetical protein
MASSGMLRRVAIVRTDVSEDLKVSIRVVPSICELGTTLAVTSNRRTLRRNTWYSCHPDEGGATFLRNVGSYKSHPALTSHKTPIFTVTAVKTSNLKSFLFIIPLAIQASIKGVFNRQLHLILTHAHVTQKPHHLCQQVAITLNQFRPAWKTWEGGKCPRQMQQAAPVSCDYFRMSGTALLTFGMPLWNSEFTQPKYCGANTLYIIQSGVLIARIMRN